MWKLLNGGGDMTNKGNKGKIGSLTLNVGGMFSGKSTELLRQGERHILAGHKVVFIKPSMDTRYSRDCIVTHKGNKVKAINVGVREVINLKSLKDADVILIDEVQFFENHLPIQVDLLLDEGKTVYCSGLDLDYNMNPFETTMKLMAMADTVRKFHAVCEHCGEDAMFSLIRGQNSSVDGIVKLGGKDDYIPVCRGCAKDYESIN